MFKNIFKLYFLTIGDYFIIPLNFISVLLPQDQNTKKLFSIFLTILKIYLSKNNIIF